MPIQPVVTGSPSISTARSKFGGSSLYFPATGEQKLDYSNKGLIFYSEFTLEFFLYYTYYDYGRKILSMPSVLDISAYSIGASQFLSVIFFDSSGVAIFSAPIPSFLTSWFHIALTRSSDNYYRIFINGVKKYEFYSTKLVNPSGTFVIGYNHTSTNLLNFDELRFKNECVYTENFTPPVSPFQTDLKTLLLLHFDGISGSQTFIDSSDIGVCDTPAASVPSGDYSSPFHVALSCITPESVIFYRIDSGDWIQSDLIQIQNSCTVQVKSVKNNLQDSDILTLNYTVKCSPPVFNLDSGFYASAIQIVLSNNDEHNIYYKIGSGEWIQGDNILIDSACVVYAKCTDSGLQDSDIISRVFNFMSAGSGGGTIDLTGVELKLDDVSAKLLAINTNLTAVAASAVNPIDLANSNL